MSDDGAADSILLMCMGCGACVTITPDTETLTCRQCKTRQRVWRSGNTVSLENLTGTVVEAGMATARDSSNTDRVATDRAIRHLEDVLDSLDEEDDRVAETMHGLRISNQPSDGEMIVATAFVGIPASILAYNTFDARWYGVLITFVVSSVAAIYTWRALRLVRLKKRQAELTRRRVSVFQEQWQLKDKLEGPERKPSSG